MLYIIYYILYIIYIDSAGWEDPEEFIVTLGEHHLERESGNEISRNILQIVKVWYIS